MVHFVSHYVPRELQFSGPVLRVKTWNPGGMDQMTTAVKQESCYLLILSWLVNGPSAMDPNENIMVGSSLSGEVVQQVQPAGYTQGVV